ncbi:RNase E specificity factor CsrD [Shewanella avicenniae]|uniref:RNase E specificity factor CsrD n=1 Tax=Shewanella avicenniae TaxID=2814294 RepID=A0ABX7QQQ6_9GAMM|nr:RNase E specificity factor CsrD [Shewanella avicenniae]QSX33251.1 RNase E specificity factor CsrD [Shewanella avicenniae]
MELTRLLTIRLSRFWLLSLSITFLVGLLMAIMAYSQLTYRFQQHHIDVIEQSLASHLHQQELPQINLWLPDLIRSADALEARVWNGQELLYEYVSGQLADMPRVIDLQLPQQPKVRMQLLLPQPLWHYLPNKFEIWIVLMGFVGVLITARLGYRWYADQLAGLETIGERCHLILKGRYELARNRYSKGHPRFINRAISQLLDQLAEAKKERARFDTFIRSNTFLDHETRIGNRLLFDNRLDALSGSSGMMSHGALLLLEFEELEQLHQLLGDNGLREYLLLNVDHIGRMLQSVPNSVLTRRSHSQFAVLVTQISLAEAEQLASRLVKLCASLKPDEVAQHDAFCHVGCAYFKLGDEPNQLLEEAEMALRAAQMQGNNNWFMYDKGAVDAEFARGSVRWRTFLEMALADKRFVNFAQPVIDADGLVHHREIFTRAREVDGNLVRATLFLPMAIKCGLIPQIERFTLERIIYDLLPSGHGADYFSINLAHDTLMNNDFFRWLKRIMLEHRDLMPRLIVEVDESFTVEALVQLQPRLQMIKMMGARLCVDHVGQQVISTQYIVEAGFDMVKLHRSLVKQIHLRPENQLFIRSLMGSLPLTDIDVVAEGVELLEEWQTLKILGISAAQGPLFSDPISID